MCIKDNQEFHKKLDAFDPNKIIEVVSQVVASGYQKSFQKTNLFSKPTNTCNKNPKQVKPTIHLADHTLVHLESCKLLWAQTAV